MNGEISASAMENPSLVATAADFTFDPSQSAEKNRYMSMEDVEKEESQKTPQPQTLQHLQ